MDIKFFVDCLNDQVEYWKAEASKDPLILYNKIYYEGAIDAIFKIMDELGVEHEERIYF